MIIGIGTDIVSITRIEGSLSRQGERFARRLLHDQEWDAYTQSNFPARLLAKRFAAKEAVAKALGTGFRQGMGPRHIAIDHDDLGRPLVIYTGPAEALRQSRGVQASFLSISDEKDYAVAYVVLTTTL